jgi:hypothetical protein
LSYFIHYSSQVCVCYDLGGSYTTAKITAAFCGLICITASFRKKTVVSTFSLNVYVYFSQEITCESAYQKCLFRGGCKQMLLNFMTSCQDIQGGHSNVCSMGCRRALIGLTSTEEGKLLTNVSLNGILTIFKKILDRWFLSISFILFFGKNF